MPQISVIIPAYNAESGLEKSVRSVLAQTYRDVEIWIVNDGSLDRTGEVANRFARQDSRVHVIHQQNCGCYQARLNALKKIKTPYFGFIDADDLIEPSMYAKMLSFMEANNFDVVQCGYDINGVKQEWLGPQEALNCRDEVINKYVSPALVAGVLGGTFVWNKLYRNKYDFSTFDPTDRDTTFEDMIYNLQFFLTVERMGFIDEPLYHYIINEGSSVRNFTEKSLHDFKECIRVRRAIIPLYDISDVERLNRHWLRTNIKNCLISALRSRLPMSIRIKNALSILKV